MKKTILSIGVLCLAMIFCLVGCSDSSTTKSEQIVWNFETKGMVQSSPVIYENMILFGSENKNFYAVDLETKKQIWSIPAAAGVNSKALIKGNTVYFTGGEICYAADVKSGEVKWQCDAQVQNKLRKDWDFHDASLAVYKDIILFATADGRVLGLNQQDGSIKWKFSTGKDQPIRTTPAIQGNLMFFGDWGGNFYAVDLDTQTLKWSVNTGEKPIQTAPCVYNNTVYFGGRDAILHALDINDGKEKWSYNDPQQSWFTGEIFVEKDILYVAGSDNHQVVALNPVTGDVVQKYQGEKNIFSKQIIDDGVMYVCDGDAYNTPGSGNIYAFDLKNGEKALWKVSVKGNIFSSPIIHNGNIYFGSSDGNVYGVTKPAK